MAVEEAEMMTMIVVRSQLPGKKYLKEEMMNLKINLKQNKSKLFLYFAIFGFFILSFMLFACGDGNSNNNSADSSDTGSIAFNIVWDGGSLNLNNRALTGNVCDDYLIETINATITNSSDTTVASASWACSARQGTITGVPPGSDLQVIIEGLVAGGNVHWRGQVTGITVNANQATDAGTITLSYIGTNAALLWDVHTWDNANWN